jgi:uncharacterized protein involved in high-affinity Fe2+ transport
MVEVIVFVSVVVVVNVVVGVGRCRQLHPAEISAAGKPPQLGGVGYTVVYLQLVLLAPRYDTKLASNSRILSTVRSTRLYNFSFLWTSRH